MSAPALSWDAIFNMTKAWIYSRSWDVFVKKVWEKKEKSMRGGVSYIFKRYIKANNNLKSYYPKEDSKQIIYLQANNLYDYVMTKFLPATQFLWIDPKEFDLNTYTNNISNDCNLKVDLQYPKELRKLHSYYPIAPDKIEIKRERLSNYQLKIL